MSEDYDLFLSHGFKDQEWVCGLVKALSQRNLRVWSDSEAIKAGDSWREAIDEGIRMSKSFVTIITPESVSSSFMAAELVQLLL